MSERSTRKQSKKKLESSNSSLKAISKSKNKKKKEESSSSSVKATNKSKNKKKKEESSSSSVKATPQKQKYSSLILESKTKPKKKEESIEQKEYSLESKSSIELIPQDIMGKIASYLGSIDTKNALISSSTMNVMKYGIPMDLSDVVISLTNLYEARDQLSKYKITGLNIEEDEKDVVSTKKLADAAMIKILSLVTNLKVNINTSVKMDKILSLFPKLTSLTYKGPMESFNNFISTKPKLTFLSLTINKSGRVKGLKNLSNLTQLEIYGGNGHINLGSFVKLKHLTLVTNSNITNIEQCIQLEKLIIHNNEIESFDISNLTSLVEISINDAERLEEIIGLTDNQSLQKITLIDLQSLDSLEIGTCPSLKYLYISNKENIFEPLSLDKCLKLEHIEIIYGMTLESIPKSVKYLYLSKGAQLQFKLLKNCIKLEELSFDSDIKIDNLQPIRKCNNLRLLCLDVAYIKSIDGIESLTSLENLQINLNRSHNKPDLSLIGNCVNLKRLSLIGVNTESPPLDKCVNLIFVYLGNVTQIIGMENCINLTSVEIYNSSITNLSCVRKCSKLKTLRLSILNKLVSLGGIEGCTSLIKINIDSCIKLRDISLLKECTNLTIFSGSHIYAPNTHSSLALCKSLVDIKLFYSPDDNYTPFNKLPLLSCLKIFEKDKESNWLLDRKTVEESDEDED